MTNDQTKKNGPHVAFAVVSVGVTCATLGQFVGMVAGIIAAVIFAVFASLAFME